MPFDLTHIALRAMRGNAPQSVAVSRQGSRDLRSAMRGARPRREGGNLHDLGGAAGLPAYRALSDARNADMLDGKHLNEVLPAGIVLPYGGPTAPFGFLLCDGSAVSRVTYSSLFNVFGITYGSGDGSTTFNLPDLRGRLPVGKGTHADVNALANNDGAALASRTPKHTHAGPSHQHNLKMSWNAANARFEAASGGDGAAFTAAHQWAQSGPLNQASNGMLTDAGGTGATGNAGGSWVVVNFIIKT